MFSFFYAYFAALLSRNQPKQKHHDFHHSAHAWLTTIEEVITAIKQDLKVQF